MIASLVILMQLAATQHSSAARLAPADSARLRAMIDSATRQFQLEWSDAWKDTQRAHPLLASGEYVREGDERGRALHCHWTAVTRWMKQHVIAGNTVAQADCPRFLPPDVVSVDDERRSLDNGLAPRYRWRIAAARAQLRLLLDSAAQQLPHDIHVAGQRVRFALDDGDVAGAARAAAACGFEPAQCGLLQGLILYRVGDIARADSAFVAAAALMSADKRCEWNDVRLLLDASVRPRYESLPCSARAELEARLWWLADPLWIEPGNERRAEHFARKVTIGLVAALGDDGRQHFMPREGGESVMETLLRYGWPSQMFWGGYDVDYSHGSWLRARGAEVAPPYVVREYTRHGRLHTLPPAPTLDAPFTAPRGGWQLNAPDGEDDWWPQEHYARDSSEIVDLPAGQSVMLPRRDSTRFVWAGDLDSATAGRTIDSTRRATLFDSRSVGSVRQVASFSLRGARAVVDAPLAAGRTLLGIEVPGDHLHAAARARYGIEVGAPLSALGAAKALSEALLFDPPGDAAGSVETAQAVARMYGSTTLRRAARVGVYWESYGFGAADTVDVSVRVTRQDQPNVVVRAMHVLGVGDPAGNDVAVRWREVPGNSRALQRLEGNVPLQLRSIVLELSQLPPGGYVLQLGMNRPGEAAVTSERRFSLR